MKDIQIDHHIDAGCSYHRVWLPIINMGRAGFTGSVTHRSAREPYFDNIFFFNRIPLSNIDKLEEFKANGTRIVVDIDDHWILYPHHEMAATWMKTKAHEQIQHCLSVADMVFTTNERLKIAASHLCNNIHVVPNGLPFDSLYQPQFHPGLHIYSDRVRFMYAAGSSHLHDLSVIKPVMKRLGSDSDFRQRGEIVLAGYQHEYGQGAVNSPWPKMLNIIKHAGSYNTIGHRTIEVYMDCYNSADVALAPLEETTFNACKSNLKTLEAGCKNIPIIASNVEPYTQDRECPGVILCSTTKEWYEAIKMLMGDAKLRKDLGKELGEYVRKKYHIDIFVKQRIELFKTL